MHPFVFRRPAAVESFASGHGSSRRAAPACRLTTLNGSEVARIHTSGHASPADLRAFANALLPKVVIPVHGNDWDAHADGFGNLKRLSEGEQYAIT
jgi:L-ascorbate metabolism protein UlaG (beta-lactamase superfamily)